MLIYLDEFLNNIKRISNYETLCIHHIYNMVGSHKDNDNITRKL